MEKVDKNDSEIVKTESDVLEDTPGAKDVGYEGLQILGERKKEEEGVE